MGRLFSKRVHKAIKDSGLFRAVYAKEVKTGEIKMFEIDKVPEGFEVLANQIFRGLFLRRK